MLKKTIYMRRRMSICVRVRVRACVWRTKSPSGIKWGSVIRIVDKRGKWLAGRELGGNKKSRQEPEGLMPLPLFSEFSCHAGIFLQVQ